MFLVKSIHLSNILIVNFKIVILSNEYLFLVKPNYFRQVINNVRTFILTVGEAKKLTGFFGLGWELLAVMEVINS